MAEELIIAHDALVRTIAEVRFGRLLNKYDACTDFKLRAYYLEEIKSLAKTYGFSA